MTIDGIDYFLYLDTYEAVITCGINCSGELDIPSEVCYDGETFVVKSMTWNAFYDNSGLTKVRIPKTLENILHYYPVDPDDEGGPTGMVSSLNMNPFMGCTALESIEVDSENPSLKSIDGVLFSQDGVGQYYYKTNNYQGTGLYCYPAGRLQGSYTIPETVEWIGADAFYHSQYLIMLTIPNSIKNLCEYSFNGCSSLEIVCCYAEDVPRTGSDVFKDTPIVSVTLYVPAGSVDKYKETSPWNAFGRIEALVRTVTITIDGIDYFLNYNTHEAVITCGNKCTGELDIPSEVSYDGETFVVKSMIWKAFDGCTELTKVRIPKTLESIMHEYPRGPVYGDVEHSYSFYPCTNPFTGCTALESIEVDEDNPGMKSAGGLLFSKDGTELYAYPPGIKEASYDVPKGVIRIGSFALANDNLKKIDLAESVQTVGLKMCYDSSLDTLIIRGQNVQDISMRGWFLRCLKETAKLYVPASEVDRYKSFFAGDVLPLEEYGNGTEAPVTFTKDQMATVVLPTEPDASKGKYYRLDRCEDGQIIFEQELQPRARVPYIIVPSEDFSIDPGTLDLEGCRPDTASITGISFIGTYVSEVLPSLGGDGGGSLYYDIIDTTPDCGFTTSGETGTFLIGALRAYLEVDWDKLTWDDPIDHGGSRVPGKKLGIVLLDHATGINEVELGTSKAESLIYNLAGQRISKPAKGIYIENGQKRVR